MSDIAFFNIGEWKKKQQITYMDVGFCCTNQDCENAEPYQNGDAKLTRYTCKHQKIEPAPSARQFSELTNSVMLLKRKRDRFRSLSLLVLSRILCGQSV